MSVLPSSSSNDLFSPSSRNPKNVRDHREERRPRKPCWQDSRRYRCALFKTKTFPSPSPGHVQSNACTGGSSGIGLATVELLLEQGASVVVGDQQPIPITHSGLTYVETDVASWPSLIALFNKAIEVHGHIDHVFANAGIGGYRADYLASPLDAETGELLEPSSMTLDINLKAVINTAYLGMHHMREQNTAGSVVLTASASSIQRFRNADYAVAKHGVLGFMRGIVPNVQARNLPIRVNCIAPTFTRTGMVSAEGFRAIGREDLLQEPEVVARSTAVLMADEGRQGQVVYSAGGRLWEIEESKLLPMADEIVGIYNEETVSWPHAASLFVSPMCETRVKGEMPLSP